MNILLTGASGFLAQHIIPELKTHGHQVIGVDKRPEAFLKTDYFVQTNIIDLGYRDMSNIDAVIHLGWRTNIPDCERHPVASTEDNIVMTDHLMELCKEAGVKKFVFPSTASLYSHNPTPWTEDMTLLPIEHYSWQKLACEALCQMSPIETVVLRFFQIFGEYQRPDSALAAFFRLREEGKPITLTQTMAQSTFDSAQRDFIYAGDVARAVRLAVESPLPVQHDTFNVASGTVHTMQEIAEAVGGNVEWIPRREYEVERHHGDIQKIKNGLGWQPEVDIISWIKKQNETL